MNEIKSGGAILIMLMTLLFAFIGFSLNGASWMPKKDTSLVNLRIAGVSIEVEIADEPKEQERGLLKNKILRKNSGMLFVFDEAAKWSITTKGMSFPIDIFWINGDKKIIEIREYASPNSGEIYVPKIPAKYILETNADFASIYGIKVGDSISDI